MSMWLRQSTASQEILIGPFLDSTDGNSQETGLSIQPTDIKIWKEGATSEAIKNSGGATHIVSGRYYLVLDATDTNTVGKMEINIHMAGALPVRREYMVMPANVYDSLLLGTDNLDVSAVQLAGQTITAGAGVTFPSSVASPTNITAGTITTTTNLTNLPSIPAGWLTAAGIASNALNGKGDWNVGKTGYSLTQGFPSNFASLSITAGGLVDPVVSSVAGAVWNAATASYGTANTYGALIETNLDAAVSSISAGSGPSAATIADAVWDEALSGHATGGSAGAALTGAGSAGDPWSTLIPGAYGAGTAGQILGDNIDAAISSISAGSGPTAAAIRAEIDSNSTQLAAIKTKTDYLPSATAGASGGLFIAGSNAATTVNFTGTISTVTNLTNLPSIPSGWLTAAGIASGALNGKGDWNVGKTGYSLTQSFPTNFSSMSISAGGLVDILQTAADKAWGTTTRLLTAGTNIALAKGTGVTGFSDLDAAATATAVWNAATATYGSAGSYGLLIETNLDAQVSSISGGGGGTADWTANQLTSIMAILGIPTSGTTPLDPSTGILDTIRDAILAVKAKTDNLPADPADASDIASSFTGVNTKLDTIDNFVDTEIADIQSRLPAALVGGRMDANLSAISNSTTDLAAFQRAVKGNVIGTVGGGSTTTSIVSSALTPAGSVADKFKGRLLVFASDTTTANLRGQATDITSNTSSAAPTFTVTALTTSPVSGDTFCIL